MSCLFSILCLCKMLGFIMAPSDRQLRTTCKKPPKHNRKQKPPNPGVQLPIQPNFRVIFCLYWYPQTISILNKDDVNEESRVRKKAGKLLLQRGKWVAIQHLQTVSGALFQIRMAVLFVSLLLRLLLPTLCLVMARRLKLRLGWNYGLGCLSKVINHSAFLRCCMQPLLLECRFAIEFLGWQTLPSLWLLVAIRRREQGPGCSRLIYPSLTFQGASLKQSPHHLCERCFAFGVHQRFSWGNT